MAGNHSGAGLLRDIGSWFAEFLDPIYTLCPGKPSPESQKVEADVNRLSEDYDVVLYIKPGCGFCASAEALLTNEGISFKAIDGTDEASRLGLKQALRLPLLSFPLIFVKGTYIGGSDQLHELKDSGRLDSYVKATKQPFPGTPPEDPVKLFVGPNSMPWYCFQTQVYGNVVRAASFVQVLLLVLFLFTYQSTPALAGAIIWLLIFDLTIFAILGPTPIAPIWTFVTLLTWRFRGGAVSSWPYKLVFLTYVVTFANGMLGAGVGSLAIGATGLAANSAMLAILRF